MPRQARQASGTGIYHVMMRGINHQNIFEEQEELDHMTNQEVAVWYNDNVFLTNTNRTD